MTAVAYRRRTAHLDLSAIGLGQGPRTSDYMATPAGTNVIAWAGVDGIHFGTIRGQGETVFAISPANIPGECIHPVAASIEEFLRLVLAADGTAAIEQAWMWDEVGFSVYLVENPPDEAQQTVLAALRETFDLSPMPGAYAYLHAIQADFDERKLPLRRDYRECVALHEADYGRAGH